MSGKKYQKCIHEYIHTHREEIVNALTELVKIPSVRGQACEGAPYGKFCGDVLQYTEELYQENGFGTALFGEDGYLLSYCGNGTKSLGLFAHADVVAPGDDWIYADPFAPIEKDGFLFGRGVWDDKAAIVISLYCAKMIKELSLPFESRLICFTGVNEESGMQDIRNYMATHKAPDFALICDSGYPLYRGNKGILRLMATADMPCEEVKDFTGGESLNIMLGKATVKCRFRQELFDELEEILTQTEAGERIKLMVEEHITLVADGIASHAALPEGSLNAGYVAAKVLAQCQNLPESDRRQMKLLEKVLDRYYGEIFDIENDDPEFGRLTCANGVIRMPDGKLQLSFDIRLGAEVKLEEIKKKITEFFALHQWKVEIISEESAHAVSADNPYVQTCLRTYQEFTGDSEGQSRLNAGGTYGRYLPCAAEIGATLGAATFPYKMPAGHGQVHQPDEYISIDGLLNAMELTMLMLLECDKV